MGCKGTTLFSITQYPLIILFLQNFFGVFRGVVGCGGVGCMGLVILYIYYIGRDFVIFLFGIDHFSGHSAVDGDGLSVDEVVVGLAEEECCLSDIFGFSDAVGGVEVVVDVA